MLRYLFAGLAGLYLVLPTGGLIEFAPDIIPFIGHLDEIAATFVMTVMAGYKPGLEREFKAYEIVLITILGLASIVYLMFPTLGTVEFIPDFIPVVGNLDEVLASIIAFTMRNAYRAPTQPKQKTQPHLVEPDEQEDLIVELWRQDQDTSAKGTPEADK